MFEPERRVLRLQWSEPYNGRKNILSGEEQLFQKPLIIKLKFITMLPYPCQDAMVKWTIRDELSGFHCFLCGEGAHSGKPISKKTWGFLIFYGTPLSMIVICWRSGVSFEGNFLHDWLMVSASNTSHVMLEYWNDGFMDRYYPDRGWRSVRLQRTWGWRPRILCLVPQVLRSSG